MTERASERFELVVGPPTTRSNVVMRLARLTLWFLDGSDADSSAQRVVVRDRETGEIMFKDTSGDRRMEELLRGDLDRLSVSEFSERWGLSNRP